MGLAFYDSGHTLFNTNPFRAFFNGHLGGTYEEKIYLRNDDPSIYLTDLTVLPEFTGSADYGEFGETGWGIKLMYGERRPTEAEWDLVRSGDAIAVHNIGSTSATDTHTYYPVWVRISCPGNEAAQLRDTIRVRVLFVDRKVGA